MRNLTKRLPGSPQPYSLACHYYEEFYGALHSIVIDVTSRRLEVCFGSPTAKRWHAFSFENPEVGQYETLLPLEKTPTSFRAPPAK